MASPQQQARSNKLYGGRTAGQSYERPAVSTIGRLSVAARMKGDPVAAKRYSQAEKEFATLCERAKLSDNEAMALGGAIRHCELHPYTPEKHPNLPEPVRLAVVQKHGERAAARIDAGFAVAAGHMKDLPVLTEIMSSSGVYLHPDVVQLAADIGATTEK